MEECLFALIGRTQINRKQAKKVQSSLVREVIYQIGNFYLQQ